MDKSQNRAILLHKFKLGHNAVEATGHINQAWGPDSAKEKTVRRWFQKFASGGMGLKT